MSKFGWYSKSIINKDGQRAIGYRTPDGQHGQTLWFENIRQAAAAFEQIKLDWQKNKELEEEWPHTLSSTH